MTSGKIIKFSCYKAVLLFGCICALYAEPIVIIDGVPIDEKVIDRKMKAYAGRLTEEEYIQKRSDYVAETINLFLKRKFSEEKLSHIKVKEEDINRSIEEIKQNMQKDPELKGISFEEILAFQDISMEELRKRQVYNIRYVKHLNSLVTEEMCRKIFEKHKEFFDGTQVRISIIFLSIEKRNEEEKKEILKKARMITKDLKKTTDPLSFEKMAQEYSDHPSKQKGGDIGYLKRFGSIPDPLAYEAFSMEIGEISGLFAGPYGYHIICVTDKKKGTRDTFKECRAAVFNYLLYLEEQKLLAKLIQQAKIIFPKKKNHEDITKGGASKTLNPKALNSKQILNTKDQTSKQ